MFDISLSELLLVFVVGTIILKPKDLVNILQKFNKLSKFDKKLPNKAEGEEDFFSFNKANLFDQDDKVEKKKWLGILTYRTYNTFVNLYLTIYGIRSNFLSRMIINCNYMKTKSINKLHKGAYFIIEHFSLDKIQKLKLMELGILPKIKIKLLKNNNFGSSIIKCEGVKYALDNSIAQKLITNEVVN